MIDNPLNIVQFLYLLYIPFGTNSIQYGHLCCLFFKTSFTHLLCYKSKFSYNTSRNFFDICEILFFRTEDEAQAYYAAYLAELTGGEPPVVGGDETTEAPVVETTEAPTEEPTEEPTEAPTQAPTEAPTQAPVVEDPTEAPTQAPAVEDPTDAPEEPKKGGCGSVVGIGAIAVVAFAAAGLVSFKKKED